VVAIYQLSAARGQLNDMGSQLDVMRKDQRAWIAVDVKDHPNIAIGQPLSVELNTKNTGSGDSLHRTGAERLKSSFRVDTHTTRTMVCGGSAS
jgi:hypothetical protein